ncbi:MAG: hypothetical protein MJ000_08630 [Bacteroidales bacterium]|nr:hypothetical protein [Bacteroidales bacterium]
MSRLASGNIPEIINELHIESVFAPSCSTDVASCYDYSSDSDLYAYDTKYSYSDWENSTPSFVNKTFHIINNNKNQIVLLQIDHKLMTAKNWTPGGTADCALMTNQIFTMVEFKTNAFSEDKIKNNAKNAKEQLHKTYKKIVRLFRDQGIDLRSFFPIQELYVVFDATLGVTSARADIMNLTMQPKNAKMPPTFFENKREY